MPWQVVLVIYLLVARAITPIFNKRIATDPCKPRNLFMQFFLASLLALTAVSIFDVLVIDWKFIAITSMCTVNALACYAYWQAIDISLSKTSMFTQADDLITLSLGFLILGEAKFVTWSLGIGILLCMGAASLFAYRKWYLAEGTASLISKKSYLAIWIAIYSVIWGCLVFAMRYFALQGVTTLNFATAWYFGSFLGAQVLYWVSESRRDKNIKVPKFTVNNLKAVVRVVACIYTAMILGYWVRSLAPISAVQPIDQVAEMIFPTLIGLYYFKEIKHLDFVSKIAMFVGLIGGLLIAFSY